MDIFAHALWTGILAKIVSQKTKLRIPLAWAAFWGIFPDMLSSIGWHAWIGLGFGGLHSHAADSFLLRFGVTDPFYNLSHSIIVFIVVFIAVSLILNRVVWVLGGWLLHILIDIPTHGTQFYPTPFLWPLLDIRVNGVWWGQLWFLVLNYSLLVIVTAYLWREDIRKGFRILRLSKR
jgi:hypothetical protein